MSAPGRDEDLQDPQDLGRFTTFLDAVVAIAITLLVLPLVDITVTAEPDRPLGTLLADNTGLLASFALSFAVIVRVWRAHHLIFEKIARYDELVVRASILWVFTIVLLPFPTRLISVYATGRLSLAIYIGTLVLGSATLTVTHLHIARTPALWRPGITTVDTTGSVVTTTLMVLALAVALVVPSVGFAALFLLLLSPVLERPIRRRRQPAG